VEQNVFYVKIFYGKKEVIEKAKEFLE